MMKQMLINKINFRLFVSFILFHLFFTISAQELILKKGKAVFVINKNSIEYSGIVGTVNDSVFYLRQGVKDSIPFSRHNFPEVIAITEDNILNGKKITEDLFHVFNPTFATAFPLKKKSIYYSNSNLLYNSAYFGVTNRLSFSVNTTPFFAPLGVSLRYSIPLNDHFFLAPEAGLGTGSWLLSKIRAFHFGTRASQGNSQRNITAGVGYFYLDGIRSYLRKGPVKDSVRLIYVNFGYKYRFSKKFSFNADFWYVNKPEFFVPGIFIRSHNLPDRQWRFGSLFFVFRTPKRGWMTIPVPVIQWNYTFG